MQIFFKNFCVVSLTFPAFRGNLSQMIDTSLNVYDRNIALDNDAKVRLFFAKNKEMVPLVANMTPECAYVVKAVVSIGQQHIFSGAAVEEMRDLVGTLLLIEEYYADIGGIIGYQEKVRALLLDNESCDAWEYHPPAGVDFTCDSKKRREATLKGLESLPCIGEVYPIGGAAERLQNKDSRGKHLPAAPLSFLGRPLLEGLIRDVEAREYLYRKVFGKEVVTPIVLMTSGANDNHAIVSDLLKKAGYFDRDPESFFVFSQPLVPSFDLTGRWVLQKCGKLLMKPGGHGAIWKLAIQSGAFAWLKERGRTKLLVRQINNPIAGTDGLLLSLMGEGILQNKQFGFASCERLVGASEGVNVLKKCGDLSTISNIEYCAFSRYNIKDKPRQPGDAYSLYPSNTNILFADLEAIEKGTKELPYPGPLINFKKGSARLETTMQNIADVFLSKSETPKTFITFNQRQKTISTAKKEYVHGENLAETPYGCFIDYQKNALALLAECGFSVGETGVFIYHPALGPLYEVIRQKLKRGYLRERSELQLEIAEFLSENLDIQGSLLVTARTLTASVYLRDVRVENMGVDWSATKDLWKNQYHRKGACQIRLGDGAEFVAEEVVFEGDVTIDVPANTRLRAEQQGGELILREEPLTRRSWEYALSENHHIVLKRSGSDKLLEKIRHEKTPTP